MRRRPTPPRRQREPEASEAPTQPQPSRPRVVLRPGADPVALLSILFDQVNTLATTLQALAGCFTEAAPAGTAPPDTTPEPRRTFGATRAPAEPRSRETVSREDADANGDDASPDAPASETEATVDASRHDA